MIKLHHSPCRSLQSQMSISLVAECSRTLRSSAARNSASWPISVKTLATCVINRTWLPCINRKADAIQLGPSAEGNACSTRFSFEAGNFGKMNTNLGASSEISLPRVKPTIVVLNPGTRSSKSSRPSTSSNERAGCSF